MRGSHRRRLDPAPPAPPAGGSLAPHTVLFLCTGNSARSQAAEALARVRSGGRVQAFSAGSHPRPLHPDAVRVMAGRGIDLAGQRPRHLSVFAAERFDYVITLCDRVREGTYPAFEQMAAELEIRIGFWLAAAGVAPAGSFVQEA